MSENQDNTAGTMDDCEVLEAPSEPSIVSSLNDCSGLGLTFYVVNW